MADEVVTVKDVWVRYNNTLALKGVSLTIEKNDFMGIIGPNGSGKTTLLKVIAGLIKPERGQVLILGEPPVKARNSIGYVPQYSLFDADFPISVSDVVLTGRCGLAGLFHKYSEADRRAADGALESVDMLEHRDRRIGELSGGQRQRVFIARALVAEPQLLLLDEPTSSVASDAQNEFYQLLNRLKSKMAIVLVTHDISAISIYVDKLACLNVELYYHGSKEITPEILESTYKCPVQMIAHGAIPHWVVKGH